MVSRSIYCHWELITKGNMYITEKKRFLHHFKSSLTAKTFLHKNDVQKIDTNKSMLSINAETCAILWFQCKRRIVLSKEVATHTYSKPRQWFPNVESEGKI